MLPQSSSTKCMVDMALESIRHHTDLSSATDGRIEHVSSACYLAVIHSRPIATKQDDPAREREESEL